MGKSSSSSKKIKHSKDSSKLRSVKKKKTKREKSKKIRRIRDYSDDSESSGTDSSLYSSSEDDYRRQKRRSKVSKKRSRKRYSSSESDDDDDVDDTLLLKKKKKSKRKDELVGKKKKQKKNVSRKRRKRDSSSSSFTSSQDSQSDDSSDSDSESDGKRRIRDRGRLGKVKAERRRRSKDESEEEISEPLLEDELMSQKNSPRLKSIIVVSYGYGNDERKEDMVDDHDGGNSDYSNRELGHNEESDERDGETGGYDEVGKYICSETSKDSHLENNSMKDDDLEAILKKRALENFKKFRGENGIARKEVSSVAGGETLQIESEKTQSHDHGVESKDLEASQKVLQTVASPQDQQLGDTAKAKVSFGVSSCTTKPELVRPVLGQESLNLASTEEANACQNAEAESISGRAIDKNCPGSSQALETKNGGEENIESKEVSSTLNEQSFSRLDETKEGSQSEQKTLDETKQGSPTDEKNDGSQYEQKTMTVMRGGEMVQVSYKVYIPKKTSALGRRRLQR